MDFKEQRVAWHSGFWSRWESMTGGQALFNEKWLSCMNCRDPKLVQSVPMISYKFNLIYICLSICRPRTYTTHVYRSPYVADRGIG